MLTESVSTQLAELYINGQYSELLEMFKEPEFITSYEDLSLEGKAECQYYRCRTLGSQGLYQKAFNLATEFSLILKVDENDHIYLAFLSAKLFALKPLKRNSDLDILLKEGKIALNQLYENDTISKMNVTIKFWLSILLTAMADLYLGNLDYDSSQTCHSESLKLRQSILHEYSILSIMKFYLASSWGNLALAQHILGNVDDALEGYNHALDLLPTRGNDKFLTLSYHNISSVYFDKGEFDKALTIIEKSKFHADRLGNDFYIINNLRALGEIYLHKGFFTESNRYFTFGLDVAVNLPSIDSQIHFLFHLVNVSILQGKLDRAKNYYEDMKNTVIQEKDLSIAHFIKIAEGLILLNQPRLKSQLLSQEIFEEFVLSKVVHPDISFFCSILYCDLLITEYEVNQFPTVLQEVNLMIEELNNLSISLSSPLYKLQIDLLTAKREKVIGNLSKAISLLEFIIDQSYQMGFGLIHRSAFDEREKLDQLIVFWSDSLNNNSSIQKQLQEKQLASYFAEIQKIKHTLGLD